MADYEVVDLGGTPITEVTPVVVGPRGLQGEQGIQGEQGEKGDTGDQGPQGIQGLKGDTGDQGIQGLKGDTGDVGPKGDKGDTGEQGIQGIQGETGPAGADSTVPGPQGLPGADGDDGAPGVGVPAGGATGQVLAKNSGTDFDTEWTDAAAGGGVDSVNGQTGEVVLTQDNVADGTTYKQYSAAEETKLAGIASGATANATDAALRDRTTHTGAQAISTVTGLQTALDGKVAATSTITKLHGPITQAAYDALDPVDADTLYVIVG